MTSTDQDTATTPTTSAGHPVVRSTDNGRIYSNQGAITPGASAETVDGMSLGKIGRIIDALRHERYRFSPVKRVLTLRDSRTGAPH